MRCVYYMNQFFAGLGGEEQASHAPFRQDELVGPGRLLQQLLGDEGSVVATVVCGDDYFAQNQDKALRDIKSLILEMEPDLLVAGPAFGSGRYGWACAHIASAIQETGIPSVTGMHEENPGLELLGQHLYVVPASVAASSMKDVLGRMLELGRKLVREELVGSAAENGYYPRGIRRNAIVALPAAERLVEQLVRKISGQPFETEIELPTYEHVQPSRLGAPLSESRIALVTEAGLVPAGNPDRLESARATTWSTYSIEGLTDLESSSYELRHGTFDKSNVYEDPDRVLPVDVMREYEEAQRIGGLHDDYYVTCGFAMALRHAERIGREIAVHMREQNLMAAVVTST